MTSLGKARTATWDACLFPAVTCQCDYPATWDGMVTVVECVRGRTRITGADLLTALRAIISVPVALLLLAERPGTRTLAVIVFCVGGVSDLVDGYLARRSGQTSVMGAWLDPFADKLLVDSAALALAHRGQLPASIAYGLVARDLVVTCLRAPRHRQRTLVPGWLAKVKTALLYAGIGGLILSGVPNLGGVYPTDRGPADSQESVTTKASSPPRSRLLHVMQRASRWGVVAGVALSVISAIEYAIRLLRQGSQSRPTLR